MTTPNDMLRFVLEKELEADFLTALQLHKGNFSIAEICDREYLRLPGQVRLRSESYGINVEITDESVLVGLMSGQAVTAFLSKNGTERRVHFLVHPFPEAEREWFGEEIVRQVVQYMIRETIIRLRLDSEEKIRSYLTVGNGQG